MSSTDLITIVLAIIGSGGIWRIVENRLNRRDKLKDKPKLNIEEMEKDLSKLSTATLETMAYLIYPWQEHIIGRELKMIGINEYKILDRMCNSFSEIGGDGVIARNKEYIDEKFDIVPDVDITETYNYTSGH